MEHFDLIDVDVSLSWIGSTETLTSFSQNHLVISHESLVQIVSL